MSTINIAPPNAVSPVGATGQVPLRSFTAASHVLNGDFVTLTAGEIATAGINPTAVAGIAAHDSNANYGGTLSPALAPIQNVFGESQIGSPLVSASPGQTLVASLDAPNLCEINLATTVGWVTGGATQANIGTAVGLTIDGATGYWVADPGQTNKVAEIVAVVAGPGTSGSAGASGANGNLAVRVQIEFYQTALQV
jgi:hypothetical protein